MALAQLRILARGRRPEMAGSPVQVLLVSGGADDAALIEQTLRGDGLDTTVRRVHSVEEMSVALAAQQWDIVLSDDDLPAFDALAALAELHDHTPDVPYVVISGQLGEEEAVELLRSGAADVVTKGALARLAPAVRRCLRETADHNAHREADRPRTQAEAGLHELLASSPAVVYSSTDESLGSFEFVSDNIVGLIGCTADRLQAEPGLWRNLVHPADLPRLTHRASLTRRNAIDYRVRHVAGHWVWLRDDGEVVDTSTQRRVGCWVDVSEQHALEEELRRLALYDTLTDLPNRALAVSSLAMAQRRAERTGHLIGVLYLDLDRFHEVNDAYGREAGDTVLRTVAHRLSDCLRGADTAARVGGDEFLVLCEGLGDAADLAPLIDRIQAAIGQAIALRSGLVTVSCSIGIVVAGAGRPRSAEDLLQDADIAMYEAKRSGSQRTEFFDDRLRREIEARHQVEQRLRQPAPDDSMVIHYQPLFDLATRQTSGVEALLRWKRGDTLLPPASFLQVADDAALLPDLGRLVLERACIQVAQWREAAAAGSRPLMLCINVSGRELVHPHFTDGVRHALRLSGLPPQALCLELTEADLVAHLDVATEVLRALAGLGVRIALDHFGTGYGSLDYLRGLPRIELLKIDKSYVGNLGESPIDLVVTSAAVAIARAMGSRAVAEGIETAQQLQELRRLGCELGQGFLLAHPAPAEEIDLVLDLEPDRRRNEVRMDLAGD